MPLRSVWLSLCLMCSTAAAADWPQWRGPTFNGASVETGLPAEFSRTENVAWQAPLPGAAASTPVVCGKRVYLSGINAADESLIAMAFDRATGELLWQHEIARGVKKDDRSNFAAASPVADPQRAIFFFGNGDLAAFDPDGKQLWRRNIQEDYGTFAFLWTFSSSPLLHDGRLYIQVLQRDVPVDGRGFSDRPNESYLLAIDPASGQTLWRVVRPSPAVAESREAFSTPIPLTHEGRTEIVIVGGDVLTGHDPQNGKELWRWGTWNPARTPHWRHVPSPVGGGGVILACAPKREPVYAVEMGGSGTLDDKAVAWISDDVREVSSDVPTPAFYDGDFFVLSDVRKRLCRVEAATGRVKWDVATPGSAKYEASPLAADGRIYTINFDGQVAIFNAADGALLRTIAMDEPERGEIVRASIVAAGGQLFIRTTRTLYCIGKH